MSRRPDVLLLVTCLLSCLSHYTAAHDAAPPHLEPKVCQVGNVTKGCITQEGVLYSHVLHGYNSLLPPPGDVTNVEFNYFILKIIGVDERNKILSTRGWLILKWTDIRLQWKPDEFGGVQSLVLPVDRVWTPAIAIINRVGGHNGSVYYAGAHVYVTNSGELTFMPGVLLQTYCDVDLFSFPFDSQWCHIMISPAGALAKTSRTRLRLRNNAHLTDISRQFIESSEWDVNFAKIIRHPTEKVFEFDNITQVLVRLELHRRGTYHRTMLFYPACILAVALACVFLLPPASQEKVTLGGVIFLGYMILLGLLGSFLPDDITTLPLIGKACFFSLFMAAMSLVLASVISSSIHHREAKLQPMPPWLHTVLLRYLAKFVCVKKSQATAIGEGYDPTALTFHRDSESLVMNSESNNNSNAGLFRLILRELQLAANPELEQSHDVAMVQWRLGAMVIDRLLFVIYCIAMPIYIGVLLSAHGYAS